MLQEQHINSFFCISSQYQPEEEEEHDHKKPSRSNQTVRRNLDALPQKAINLCSEKIEEVLDAAIYIRKILAFGE